MSRVKRWIAINQREFHADGTLKAEAREERLRRGRSVAAIDAWEQQMRSQLEEWRRLDETDPEVEVNYKAHDFFTSEEKIRFYPDGTLKEEFRQNASRIGSSEEYLERLEYEKKQEIAMYERMSAKSAARGTNFGSYLMRMRQELESSTERNAIAMQRDLRNGEEISSLLLDLDPDEYFS